MRKRLLVILALTSAIIVWSVSGSHAQGPFPSQITAALRTLGWVTSTSTYTQWSKNFLYAANAYWNFGTVSGTSGYGIRDNAGTVQVKDSGGSWANITGGLIPSNCTTVGTVLQGAATPTCTATPILGIAGTTKGTLRFSGNTSGVITMQPAAAAGTWTLTLPTDDGTSGQYLQTDGNGITSWQTVASGITIGTTTIASGTNGRVLYDNAGVVGEMTTTGSGTVLALAASPVLVTPTLGVATATRLGIGAAADPTILFNVGTPEAAGVTPQAGVYTAGTADFLVRDTTNNVDAIVEAHSSGAYFGSLSSGKPVGILVNGAVGSVAAFFSSNSSSFATNVTVVGVNDVRALTITGGSITGSGTTGLISGTLTVNSSGVIDGIRRLAVTETSMTATSLYDAVYGGASGTTLEYSLAKGGNGYFAGTAQITGSVGIGQAPSNAALGITATLPASGLTYGQYNLITTTGSTAAVYQEGMIMSLQAGYTGTGATIAADITNSTAGTGTDPWTNFYANFGVFAGATGTTTGTNIGIQARASNGNLNYGVFGRAVTNKNSATNIGVAGFGLNGGSSPVQVGGYFGLSNTTPTFTSAALMADNGSQTDPILVARDNGTAVWSILDGGSLVSGTNGSAASAITTAGTITFSSLASSTGVRYVCANTTGVLDGQAAACVGTEAQALDVLKGFGLIGADRVAPVLSHALTDYGFALYTEQQLSDRIDAAVATALAARGVR